MSQFGGQQQSASAAAAVASAAGESNSLWKTRHPKAFAMSRNVFSVPRATAGALAGSGGGSGGAGGTNGLFASASDRERMMSALYDNKVRHNLAVYVSYIDGNDTADGTSSAAPVKTLGRAFEIVRKCGYNETAVVRVDAGYFKVRDETVSLCTGELGRQRTPVVVEGVRLEKQRDLYFTPKIDASDEGERTRLWSFIYASEAFEVYPGDIIHNTQDDRRFQVVYVSSDGVNSTVRACYNGELTPQRFLGSVYRFVNTSTNVCVGGIVELVGKSDRVYFRNIRFILEEGSYLKFFNLLLWLSNVYFVSSKGRNSTVVFDTVRKLVVGERVAREFNLAPQRRDGSSLAAGDTTSSQQESGGGGNGGGVVETTAANELVGAMFESQSNNLDVVLFNTTFLGENVGTYDASIVLKDNSALTMRNSYLISTSDKAIVYACDLSTYHFAYTRLLNVYTDAILHEEPEALNHCAIYRSDATATAR